MSQITRTYTFTDGSTAFGSQVETEFATVATAVNNLDSGAASWNNLKTVGALVASATTGNSIHGDATSTAIAAGYIGEILTSTISSQTSVGTSGQYFDITSLALTTGKWMVSGAVDYLRNGATFTSTNLLVGVGTVTGNSGTGITSADTATNLTDVVPTSFTETCLVTPTIFLALASNTTYYLKGFTSVYTVGTPKFIGRFTAIRVA